MSVLQHRIKRWTKKGIFLDIQKCYLNISEEFHTLCHSTYSTTRTKLVVFHRKICDIYQIIIIVKIKSIKSLNIILFNKKTYLCM